MLFSALSGRSDRLASTVSFETRVEAGSCPDVSLRGNRDPDIAKGNRRELARIVRPARRYLSRGMA